MKRSFLFFAALLCLASAKLNSSNKELVFENTIPVTRSADSHGTPAGPNCVWDEDRRDCKPGHVNACLSDSEGGCSGAVITPPS